MGKDKDCYKSKKCNIAVFTTVNQIGFCFAPITSETKGYHTVGTNRLDNGLKRCYSAQIHVEVKWFSLDNVVQLPPAITKFSFKNISCLR